VIHLLSAAKANARLNGRHSVSAQDVREIAPYVLRHRLIVRPGTSQEDALRQALELVPMPAEVAAV
jgi:MoxR-like ATPase